MSKYDSIKTATELVAEVKAHGLSVETLDICRAQDIMGGAPVEELVGLANMTGPAGTRDTQSVFYMIISRVWNWSQMVEFWNRYTNPQTEELKRNRDAYDFVVDESEKLRAENDKLKDRVASLLAEQTELRTRTGDAQRAAEEAEAEVVRLKAKLYDVLVEGKEGGVMVVFVVQYRTYRGADLKVSQEGYRSLEAAQRFIESRPNSPEKDPCTNYHYSTVAGEEYHIAEVVVRERREI